MLEGFRQGGTVDGRNPAPSGMYKNPSNNGISNLGAGNSKIFYFHPEPWGNDPIWTTIFQMGWFNHQLDTYPIDQSEISDIFSKVSGKVSSQPSEIEWTLPTDPQVSY